MQGKKEKRKRCHKAYVKGGCCLPSFSGRVPRGSSNWCCQRGGGQCWTLS